MQADFRLTRFHPGWLLLLQALVLVVVSRLRVVAEIQDMDEKVPAASAPSHHNLKHNPSLNTNRWSMEASLRGDESIDTVSSGQRQNKHDSLEYDWSIKLDKSGNFLLHWTVLYPQNKIIFALNINQTEAADAGGRAFRPGWDIFALGFSADGHLASSDFCIVWYDLAHRIHLQDARTDSDQRLELIDGSRSFCSLISSSSRDSGELVGAAGGGAGPLRGDRSQSTKSRLEDRSQSVKGTWKNGGGVEELHMSGEIEGGGDGDGEEEEEAEERGEKKGRLQEAEEAPEADLDKQGVQIVFSRPLDVCSRTDYYQIDNGTTHLVWFSLTGPVLTIDGLELAALMRHTQDAIRPDNKSDAPRLESGFRRVQLIASKPAGAAHPQAGAHRHRHRHNSHHRDRAHDIRMKEFPVPARDTVYWCKLFRLPEKFQTRKHHITSYQALIEPPSNEHIVHHMELFHCATSSSDDSASGARDEEEEELASLYKTGGWAGECGSPHRPPATRPCKRVLLAWAMGARPLIYPDQVGQAIGGGAGSPPQSKFGQFVMLEVHYNNPGLIGGLVDSSGLRFHYTHKLRAYEAGVMEVGLEYTDKNSIPAGVLAPLAGYCTGECTRVAMGSSSNNQLDGGGAVYVFAGQMHTHLAGVASWTEQYRAGKLVRELQRDNHYSTHFQEIRLLPEPVRLEPGDTLVHYCLYDTRRRSNVTLGGFATTDEMCVTYLHYYPKIDLEVCKSSVDSEALADYFEYLSREEAQATSSSGAVSDNYRAIRWSARSSRELLEFYAEAPLSVQCNRSNGDRFAGSWTGSPAPRLWAGGPASSPQGALWRRGGASMPTGAQLMEYRGSGFGRRHAHCDAWSEGRLPPARQTAN